ncbi:MAG: hypothetical protein PHX86_06955 [Caldisericia bacterium]|nr:hypothetical protein [Caldisericia bacterium]
MEQENPSTQKDPVQKSKKNQKTTLRNTKKWIVFGFIIVLLGSAEFGFWKGAHVESLWRNVSLKISTTTWQRYSDRSKIEKAIVSNLEEMGTRLESGQIESALEFVHPDQKEKYTQAFTTYPDRIPAFIEGLRSAKVVFISPKLNAYDTERMARVELQIPQEVNASSDDNSSYSTTLTCMLLEEKWVIDS